MNKIFIFILFSIQITILNSSELPYFKKDESYTSVRVKMIDNGWKVFHSAEADTCIEGDIRCKDRPEMESCSGSGMANCAFLWVKNKKIITIYTIGESAIFSGTSEKATIIKQNKSLGCSNYDVKNLVMDISKKEIRWQLIQLFIPFKTGITQSQIDIMKISKYPSEKKLINNILSRADKISNNLILSSIRVDNINKEIQKITCKSQIIMNVNKKDIHLDIEYTAQNTEDGQLFVEVYGL